MYILCINICIYTISIATPIVLVILNARQKHSRCKKVKPSQNSAPASSYSYMRLKNVIFGGGHGQQKCKISFRRLYQRSSHSYDLYSARNKDQKLVGLIEFFTGYYTVVSLKMYGKYDRSK